MQLAQREKEEVTEWKNALSDKTVHKLLALFNNPIKKSKFLKILSNISDLSKKPTTRGQ
jgi:Mn-dependent DtxR family transcriptional regulator